MIESNDEYLKVEIDNIHVMNKRNPNILALETMLDHVPHSNRAKFPQPSNPYVCVPRLLQKYPEF